MPGFEIGHLVVIFFIAFLVLAPNRMVEIARGLGKFTQQAQGEWWKFSQSFQEGLKNEPEKRDALPASTTETSDASAAATQPGETSQPASPSDEAGASSSAAPATVTPAPTPAASAAKRPKAKKQSKPSPQSIPDHLLELRRRLITSLVAIVIFTTIGYIFSDTLLYILRAPAGNLVLQALSPMDGFLIKFRIALYAGLYLSAPVWVYEIMMFVYPGLNPQEARLIIPGVIAIVVLFLLGNIFGYLMLSNMMGFILSMFGSELKYLPSADPFISFVIFFLAATGIAFELPIALLILMRLGLISHQTLRKQRKISYFVIFVFAELITPVADPIVAPTVVMLPMVVLFELALLVARFITPKPATVPASGSSTSS
jgi:sec-independent protein translocase protein TatC